MTAIHLRVIAFCVHFQFIMKDVVWKFRWLFLWLWVAVCKCAKNTCHVRSTSVFGYSVHVSLNTYPLSFMQPLFTMSAQQNSVKTFTSEEYNKLLESLQDSVGRVLYVLSLNHGIVNIMVWKSIFSMCFTKIVVAFLWAKYNVNQ